MFNDIFSESTPYPFEQQAYMDILGVNRMKNQKQTKRKRKEAIKVVYISSPMKVETSASKFRALVQELTGRDSDVARFMENNGADHDSPSTVHDHRGFKGADRDFVSGDVRRVDYDPYRESPTSSDSLLEPFDDVFTSKMEESFMGMLQSSFFV